VAVDRAAGGIVRTRATGVVTGAACGLVTAVALVVAGVAPAAAVAGDDRLGSREALTAGQALVSADGSQTLVLQPDGQLALFGADDVDPRWVSDGVRGGDRLTVTPGGDVRLVAPDGTLAWHTATDGNPGSALVLQDDGDLVVRDPAGAVLWDAGTTVTPSILASGGTLGPGGSLASPDGRHVLVVGDDGRVTLRGPDGEVRWTPPAMPGTTRPTGSGAATTTADDPAGEPAPDPDLAPTVAGSSLVLHADGNLVVAAPDGTRLWRSRTAGHPGATLTLQDDGDLVLYDARGQRIWSTRTQLGPARLADGDAVPAAGGLASPDGHLRLRATVRAVSLTYDDQPVWSTAVRLPAGGAFEVTPAGLSLVRRDGTTAWAVGAGAGPGAELDLDEGSALLRTASGVELWRRDVPAELLATAQVTADCTQVAGPVPESDTVTTVLGARVHRCLADAVDAMAAAAVQAGIHLGGSGWRSSAQQAALRRAHCAPTSAEPGAPVVCEPATAPVGASMHERGLALDLTQDGRLLRSGSTGFAWLQAHAAAYGLVNLPSEPWHWSTDGH
jgi:hypothetical protein